MASQVKEILESIGYKVSQKTNGYYRMPAIYRGGKNRTALSVNADTGKAFDFAEGVSLELYEIVAQTLNISDKDAKNYIGDLDASDDSSSYKMPVIEQPNLFDPKEIKDLLPSYTFYTKKGIKKELLESVGGGLSTHGRMHNRFVFPIVDLNGKLVGLAGRDVTGGCDADGSARPKWKLLGRKSKWDYPAVYTLSSIINEGSVILVESIGDWLSLSSNGINNVMVTFGTSLSNEVLKIIIGASPDRIYIALNDDSAKDRNFGQRAARSISDSLKKYFGVNQIVISPPIKNDFGSMTGCEINEWRNKFLIKNETKV